MSDQQQTRLHTLCRGCKIPLWPAVAHCPLRGCPWCRSCATRRAS